MFQDAAAIPNKPNWDISAVVTGFIVNFCAGQIQTDEMWGSYVVHTVTEPKYTWGPKKNFSVFHIQSGQMRFLH